MCDPVSVTAAASAAVSAGGALAEHAGQNKQAAGNKKAANASLFEQLRSINLRGAQEKDAAATDIHGANQQATSAAAAARVAAGESGVAGNSVDATESDISKDAANFATLTQKNLGMTLIQLDAERRGARANTQARINAVPQASGLVTGLRVAGAGLDYLTTRNARKP